MTTDMSSPFHCGALRHIGLWKGEIKVTLLTSITLGLYPNLLQPLVCSVLSRIEFATEPYVAPTVMFVTVGGYHNHNHKGQWFPKCGMGTTSDIWTGDTLGHLQF